MPVHGRACPRRVMGGDPLEHQTVVRHRLAGVLRQANLAADGGEQRSGHAEPKLADHVFQDRVARRLGDVDMEQQVAVVAMVDGLHAAVDIPGHPVDGLADVGQVFRCRMVCGDGRSLAFDHPAGGDDFEGAGTGVARSGKGQAGLRTVLPALHEGAGAGAHFHQSGQFQGDHGFAHHRPADRQAACQIPLGGQLLAGPVGAAADQGADLLGDLLVEPLGLNSLQLHFFRTLEFTVLG